MSRRRTLRDEVLARLQALDLGGAPVDLWRGDPASFNAEGVFPSVWLSYDGTLPGKLQGGTATLRDRVVFFDVLVETADEPAVPGDPDAVPPVPDVPAREGEGDALDLLEAIEAGLTGFRPTLAGMVEPTGQEELVGAWSPAAGQGRFCFAQRYQLRTPL